MTQQQQQQQQASDRVTLYGMRMATCTKRVLTVLEEAGIPYDLQVVSQCCIHPSSRLTPTVQEPCFELTGRSTRWDRDLLYSVRVRRHQHLPACGRLQIALAYY